MAADRLHRIDAERLFDRRGGFRLFTSGAVYARDLALEGVGIAYLFEPLVRDDFATGRLVEVLPQCAIEEPGLFLYYPRRASETPKLRALLDTVREVLR